MVAKIIILFFLVHSANLTVPGTLEIIKKYRYKGEAHEVETADGYLLTIHRIVSNEIQKVKKPAIFLMHGLFGSSEELLQLKYDSLPFILSNNGFDVYIGNNRGNHYSSHVKYSKNSSKFWDFSWHEIGTYDLPAMIDFVLDFTNTKKIYYYGYSQGATAVIVLLSTRPEYNQKLLQVHIAAPSIFMGNSFNIIIRKHGRMIFDSLSKGIMIDLSSIKSVFAPILLGNCNRKKPLWLLGCILIEFIIAGGNVYEIEAENDAVGKFLDTLTPYASKRQVLHYLQLSETEKFQEYDYGLRNFEKYGSDDPPEYNLSQIDAPVYIYCGGQDTIVAKKGVEILRDNLPNVANFKVIKNFNHMDFEFSKRAKEVVYLRAIKFMNSFGHEKNFKKTDSIELYKWLYRGFKFLKKMVNNSYNMVY